MCAIARMALAFGLLPPLGAHGAVATTSTAASPTDRVESFAIRTATPMRYVRTLYSGAAPTPIAAPVIPPAVAKATFTPSSTSGGGGEDAPWGILTLLAAGVIRVSGEQAA
jgi:hypothetical protein